MFTFAMGRFKCLISCLLLIFSICISSRFTSATSAEYHETSTISVDDLDGLDREFHGIGAISGGGATSKLLINYEEPYRSQILDYLFKPNFGASLQILKVEIGGDSQSTDGSESSHMHTPDDQNYNRGYEWWLMVEAKKRNSDIKLYGLPWTFPGWVGAGVFNPFKDVIATAYYVVNWIDGANKYHNLTIDYIGVWNERECNREYVKALRKTLDVRGFKNVKIVAPDAQDWSLLKDFKVDPSYATAVDIIGEHYPGAFSPVEAVETGKPLWCSEEFSAVNNLQGGGCWARVLTESVVNAKFTAFIAWNLITSYYAGLPYSRSSLMTANQPWSGHYDVETPIWITAHHTHHYHPGWYYLKPNHGVGNLTGNGTYIALTNKDHTELTIIISTMDSTNAPCFYHMPKNTVSEKQSITIQLGGTFKSIASFGVFYSYLDFSTQSSVLYENLGIVKVLNGTIELVVKRNEVYTLSTLSAYNKGDHGTPPTSSNFPVPYEDNFDNYIVGTEPYNLAQQSGSFEIVDSHDPEHNGVVAQTVVAPPVDTCRPDRMPRPVNLFGDYSWEDVHVELDVLLEYSDTGTRGVFIGSQINIGGCWTMYANGFYFWISLDNMTAWLSGNHTSSLVYASLPVTNISYGKWFTIALDVQGTAVQASLNGQTLIKTTVPQIPSAHGFVGFGPLNFGTAYFDNLKILRAKRNEYYVEDSLPMQNDLEMAAARFQDKTFDAFSWQKHQYPTKL